MAINLKVQNSKDVFSSGDAQYYKEKYDFFTNAGDPDADTVIQNLRIRHFFRTFALLSSISANTGINVDSGSQILSVYGSYNDWRIPGRPPRIDLSVDYENIIASTRGKRFDAEISLRINSSLTVGNMPSNAEAWFKLISASNADNIYFNPYDLTTSFSYNEYNTQIINPMNLLVEKRVSSIQISDIKTTTLATDINNTSEVTVTTSSPHGLSVGMCATIFSSSVSANRLFGKASGERYLGDFYVTGVPTSTTFTYSTYHNPKIITSAIEYTSSTWNDLYLEVWKLSPYEESATYSYSGNLLTLTTSSGAHNFESGDNISVKFGDSSYIKMIKISAVSGNSISAIYSDSSGIPAGTECTLIYTPRLPSGSVPYNLDSSIAAPATAVSHCDMTSLFYADRDTYYSTQSADTAIYGDTTPISAIKGQAYPIVHFPVPNNYDSAVDSGIVSEFSIYGKSSNANNARMNLRAFSVSDDTWDEDAINSSFASKINLQDSNVGTLSTRDFGNYTTGFTNTYSRFEINQDFTLNMITGKSSRSLYVTISDTSTATNLTFLTKENNEEWPYMVISTGIFAKKTPVVSIDNTYMYVVCDSIDIDLANSRFAATINTDVLTSGKFMYVRSWPMFSPGDIIEVLNTTGYDTTEAVVSELSGNKLYFTCPYSSTSFREERGAIIRNKSRMISTYNVSDVEVSIDASLISTPSSTVSVSESDKFPYPQSSEFDLRHTNNINTLLNVRYTEDGKASEVVAPVILTDVTIGDDGDRFQHIGPNDTLTLKGINMGSLSGTATAVLGSVTWEDGVSTSGVTAQLQNTSGNWTFNYRSDFDLQKQLPVLEVRNTATATQFKVSSEFLSGDIVTFISTGIYAAGHGSNFPIDSNDPSYIHYAENYYMVISEDGSDYDWIQITKSYVPRYSDTEFDPSAITYVKFSDDEITYINGKIGGAGVQPLYMYNPLTSITIKDTGIDTGSYSNRMYIQIDEKPPVIYVNSLIQSYNTPFDMYVSDVNDIVLLNGSKIPTDIQLVGNKFIKLSVTIKKFGNSSFEFTDSAGNHSKVVISIPNVDTDISVELTGMANTSDNEHVMTFTVTGEAVAIDDTVRTITLAYGNPGIYSSIGRISNIGTIGSVSGNSAQSSFTFNIRMYDSELSTGILKICVGNRYTDTLLHKYAEWYGPVSFPSTKACVSSGDILSFRGVNLQNMDITRSTQNGSFSTVDDIVVNATDTATVTLKSALFHLRWIWLGWTTVTEVLVVDPNTNEQSWVEVFNTKINETDVINYSNIYTDSTHTTKYTGEEAYAITSAAETSGSLLSPSEDDSVYDKYIDNVAYVNGLPIFRTCHPDKLEQYGYAYSTNTAAFKNIDLDGDNNSITYELQMNDALSVSHGDTSYDDMMFVFYINPSTPETPSGSITVEERNSITQNTTTETTSYTLAVSDTTNFAISDIIQDDASTMKIKLADAFIGTHSFAVLWSGPTSGEVISPQVDIGYYLSERVAQAPTISISSDDKYMEVKQYSEWVEPNDITATDYYGNDLSSKIVMSGVIDTNVLGSQYRQYYVIDSCGRKSNVEIREIFVSTGCPVYITSSKPSYSSSENIVLLIDEIKGGLFNQNYLNNIVHFKIEGKDVISSIISATSDRKSITVENPGIIGSKIAVQAFVGFDNDGYPKCEWTNVTYIAIVSPGEASKDISSSIIGTNSISKFSQVNLEPVYTKDLAYSSFSITADENNLMQNVYTILLTNAGERLYDDEFGSTLEKRVFEIITDINGEAKILSECITLVEKYEPRVVILQDKSYISLQSNKNAIDIVLYVRLPRGSARKIALTFRKST